MANYPDYPLDADPDFLDGTVNTVRARDESLITGAMRLWEILKDLFNDSEQKQEPKEEAGKSALNESED